MKMYVGITDFDWFSSLKSLGCDEVNFWKPGGKSNFKALNEGDLFLFKLHSPQDFIVGGGVFIKFSFLPTSLAWEAFGRGNGANSLSDFRNAIYKYRKSNRQLEPDPQIGCIILSMPFFFDESDWIPIPIDWNRSIVQGKNYHSTDPTGLSLYNSVVNNLKRIGFNESLVRDEADNRYGSEQLVKPRIGQGAFKVMITDIYHRKCAITGEKTLPVLEAAHIKPYSQDGPHQIQNGLLLRRDFHTLFDRGYITIGQNLTVEVSHRIHDDFGNGKEYYAHHGKKLVTLPVHGEHFPDPEYLEWHNNNIYLG